MCYNLIIKSNYQSEDAINFNDMVSKKNWHTSLSTVLSWIRKGSRYSRIVAGRPSIRVIITW